MERPELVTGAASQGNTSTENIRYSGTSGCHCWKVYSYQGGGSCSLCIDHP